MKSVDMAGSETEEMLQPGGGAPAHHSWEAGEGSSRVESEPCVGPAPPLTGFVTLSGSLTLLSLSFSSGKVRRSSPCDWPRAEMTCNKCGH